MTDLSSMFPGSSGRNRPTDAYRDGDAAWRNGYSKVRNPYCRELQAHSHAQWADGWEAAKDLTRETIGIRPCARPAQWWET